MSKKAVGTQRAFYYKSNKLLQIRGFVAVVNYGTVTEAAKMLNLTQSTVSEQINSLQQELGVKLFKKVGRLLELTEDGKELYDLVVPLWQGIDSVYDIFLNKRGESRENLLRIAGHHSVFSIFLPKYLAMLNDRQMKIDLTYETKEDAYEKLSKSEVDLAIYPMEEGEIAPKNVDCIRVFKYEPVLVMPKGHPLEKVAEKDLKPELFAEYNVLHLNTFAVSRAMQTHISLGNFKSNISIKNGTWEVLRELTRNGLGITMFHRGYLSDEDLKSLTVRSISSSAPKMFYGVIFSKNRHMNQAAKSLIKLMLENADKDFQK